MHQSSGGEAWYRSAHSEYRGYSHDGLAESDAEKHEGQEGLWVFAIRRQGKTAVEECLCFIGHVTWITKG